MSNIDPPYTKSPIVGSSISSSNCPKSWKEETFQSQWQTTFRDVMLPNGELQNQANVIQIFVLQICKCISRRHRFNLFPCESVWASCQTFPITCWGLQLHMLYLEMDDVLTFRGNGISNVFSHRWAAHPDVPPGEHPPLSNRHHLPVLRLHGNLPPRTSSAQYTITQTSLGRRGTAGSSDGLSFLEWPQPPILKSPILVNLWHLVFQWASFNRLFSI